MARNTVNREADALHLKEAIKQWQARRKAEGLPSRLADLGSLVGGISQAAVSQYANGTTPLNLKALRLFSSVLGVPPAQISKSLAKKLPGAMHGSRVMNHPAAGMVYLWSEIEDIVSGFGNEYLPDVFSVEAPSEMMGGLMKRGDAIVCSRKVKPQAGDGMLIRRAGKLTPAIYWPGATKGAHFAQLEDGTVLEPSRDGVDTLAAVVGMPTLRWARLMRWRA